MGLALALLPTVALAQDDGPDGPGFNTDALSIIGYTLIGSFALASLVRRPQSCMPLPLPMHEGRRWQTRPACCPTHLPALQTFAVLGVIVALQWPQPHVCCYAVPFSDSPRERGCCSVSVPHATT